MTSKMRSFAEWLAYIENLHPQNIELGLARIMPVFQRLGIHFACPVITVGGTNGKGSTCAMLESILMAAGYRTGLYTSPHIHHFGERVRIDGNISSEETLVRQFEAVEAARGEIQLTYFEFTTLAVMRLLADQRLDAVILEVGLGGRLDAVNILDADVAIVTNVDIDHVEYLGDTREKIGYEKAGIFRRDRVAVCGDFDAPQSLLQHAQAIGADLRLAGRDFHVEQRGGLWDFAGREMHFEALSPPRLPGANQIQNASVVLAALEALRVRLPFSEQAIRAGLARAFLPGRFQVLSGKPVVVLDVAHNPHAAAVLAANLDAMGNFAQTWAVFGAMQDKDIDGVIAAMTPRVDHWCVADLPLARAASAQRLADRLRAAGVAEADVRRFASPAEAFAFAADSAGENDRIVAFGSFWVVAGVTAAE
ncbi:MAG: bifunctional tetrahydrofolate synthase/dihydrofolate synthase [Burkholderiaceae bacterium]|nr:bifunctional tetrahydrofolate synthase/dihydrofolate synthase [Burkholderiaceae bacterium]